MEDSECSPEGVIRAIAIGAVAIGAIAISAIAPSSLLAFRFLPGYLTRSSLPPSPH